MLTRLYIDNFRCLVNFEYRPARKQLILGRNGSGKTTLLDALLFVRQFATKGEGLNDIALGHRTRWLDKPQVTYEVEAVLDERKYLYRLVLEPAGEPPVLTVASETVHLDEKPIFEFETGSVNLYNDGFERTVTYPFDASRSALATLTGNRDTELLTKFRLWFGKLVCFRLNPFDMPARAETEDRYPNVNLSNFAAWYRHLIQSNPKENAALVDSLRAAIDGVAFLGLDPWGQNVRLLFAELEEANGRRLKFYFNELSDGQRCLICLYTILHFLLANGSTVILDEPENFVSLREIQPWLMRVTDAIEEGQGQILLISHHPEMINQWAPSCGVQLVREGIGPVRIEPFRADPKSHLSPAELVARGWERG
jgi:energy-coupling factor transporter ATP-binding protein EcfA2